MGSCCGKPSRTTGGQRLGSGSAPNARIPASRTTAPPPRVTGPGRTLGEEAAPDSPRAAAARAAEERLNNSAGKGKLGRELAEQKGKTVGQNLNEASETNRRQQEQEQRLLWD